MKREEGKSGNRPENSRGRKIGDSEGGSQTSKYRARQEGSHSDYGWHSFRPAKTKEGNGRRDRPSCIHSVGAAGECGPVSCNGIQVPGEHVVRTTRADAEEEALKKVVIDTDIILGHLTGSMNSRKSSEPSLLRKVMSRYFCYTTVFNAAELFSMCRTSAERNAVEDAMAAMKVLGLNGKSARNIGLHISRSDTKRVLDIGGLVAGLCLESHLPLLTGNGSRYRGIRSLHLLNAAEFDASLKKGTVWS